VGGCALSQKWIGWIVFCALFLPVAAYAFSFSEAEDSERGQEEARAAHIQWLTSVPCRSKLKDQKIGIMIGEQASGRMRADQSNYGLFFDAINNRLRALGLKTYTPEQIKKQIAQAEIEAYLGGDPDAAITAARRLAANFLLKGVIVAHTGVNPVIGVKEVAVTMTFTLSDASGRILSTVTTSSESYSGSDVVGTALKLVNEKADEVVAKLYHDYCCQPEPTRASPKKRK